MKVALTFDDGPAEWTAPILRLLDQADAKATFFMLGCNISDHWATVLQVAAEGHEIGNHGYSHTRVRLLTDEALRSELRSTTALIEAATGGPVRLWRAPHFEVDRRTLAVGGECELAHVTATLDPGDWRGGVDRIVGECARADDGEIVDLHDGIPPRNSGVRDRADTVAALERILASVDAEFVTVSDLLLTSVMAA